MKTIKKICLTLLLAGLSMGAYAQTATNKIDTTGTVGIGTLNSLDSAQLTLRGVSASYKMLAFDGAVDDWFMGSFSGGGFFIGKDSFTSTNSKFVIKGNNVGIGTLAPTAKLHLYGESTSGNIFRLESGTAYQGLNVYGDTGSGNGKVVFQPTTTPGSGFTHQYTHFKSSVGGGTTHHGVLVDGNVGIGTTSPAHKLDVNGQIRATLNGGNAQIKLERTGASAGHGWIGANVNDVFIAQDASFNQLFRVSQAGDAHVNADLYVGDQFIHAGDVNTYMQFNEEDQWRVVTGGVGRFTINNSEIIANNPIRFGNASNLNLNIGSYITFYGSSDNRHGIGSRGADGLATDDIRLNTFGSFYINLDSNNNNSGAANFQIYRHGGTGLLSDLVFQVDGDTKAVSAYGDLIANNNLGVGTTTPKENFQIGDRWTFHNGGHKIIGYNHDYVSPDSKRIYDDEASAIRLTSDGDIWFDQAGYDVAGSTINWGRTLVLKNTGNVGIGTTSPAEIFHVDKGSDGIIGAFEGLDTDRVNIGLESNVAYLDFRNINDVQFRRQGTAAITISSAANVGVGTTNPDSKLTVKGDIHAEEVKVDLSVPGPDYVFEEDYDLTSLKELEAYIKANKHLPEIPSAKEMEEKGIDLGVMNMLLLKKIEELTLHTIAQDKALEVEKEKNASINKEQQDLLHTQQELINQLIKRIEKLENKKGS